jgi:Na+(H+)/acetate symporter ActP
MSYLTYLLIGHAAMLLHYLFFAYVVFGGFLSWRWPRMFWPHLLVAAYALGIVIIGWPCFLTDIENWSRLNTAREIMEYGFIDYHITGVFYPDEHLMTSRYVIAGIVASAYAGLGWKLYRRRSARAVGTVSG